MNGACNRGREPCGGSQDSHHHTFVRICGRLHTASTMIPHEPTEHVDNMPGIGDLIGGRYRLESVIGHGALGTVMRAEHITMGRQVAVKVLRPDISEHPAIRRRLIERVHQAQNLSHPNNCRLLDFGHAGDSLYLVMELLEGATLRMIIDRGAPYPVGWVTDIGLQMLNGLGEAHEEGLIHRNLKPANIFLLPKRRGGQRVKILDYGLASALDSFDEDEDDDRDREVCGTATYMAPETLVKQESSKATDVYAVGLILIEMLTGRQVFGGDSLTQTLYRQIHESVELPPKLTWTSLGKVLMQSVRKHPGSRFADADAFYEALEDASQSTASYFRLDVNDLHEEESEPPPETLARLMRAKRSQRDSDRDDDDEGGDESDESEPSAGEDDSDGPDASPSDDDHARPDMKRSTGWRSGGRPDGQSLDLDADYDFDFDFEPLALMPPLPMPGSNGGRSRAGALPGAHASSLDGGRTPLQRRRKSSRDDLIFAQATYPAREEFPGGAASEREATQNEAEEAPETREEKHARFWRALSEPFGLEEAGWVGRLVALWLVFAASLAGYGVYLMLA